MFSMKIEKQLNMLDRTLCLGKPRFDAVPKEVDIDGVRYSVIGISHGVKPPFLSLEIDLVKKSLVNLVAIGL